MEMIYKHTQIGTVILVLLAVMVPIVIWSMVNRWVWIGGLTGLGLLLIAIVFGTLTVELSSDKIACWFGPGLIRKEFVLAEITVVETVRYPWYYGWGIRLTPRGWMFNVSGLDAVEITLRSDKHFLIGTDRPNRLASAISQAANLRSD
jgi:hypothetical protein